MTEHTSVPIYLTTGVAHGVTKREIMGYACSCGYRPTGGYPTDQAVRVAQHITAEAHEQRLAEHLATGRWPVDAKDSVGSVVHLSEQTSPDQASPEQTPSSDAVQPPADVPKRASYQQTPIEGGPGAFW